MIRPAGKKLELACGVQDGNTLESGEVSRVERGALENLSGEVARIRVGGTLQKLAREVP